MPKLKRMSGTDACRILGQHGFKEVRRKGSHVIMQKRDEEGTITVPVPDHNELRKGTLRSIVRQSGLARALFEA